MSEAQDFWGSCRLSATVEEPVDLRQPELDLLGPVLSDRPIQESQQQAADVCLTPPWIQCIQTDLQQMSTCRFVAWVSDGGDGEEGEVERSVSRSGVVEVDDRSEFAIGLQQISGMEIGVDDVVADQLLRGDFPPDRLDAFDDSSCSAVIVTKRIMEQ